jgi:two-component system sensor histidine kinase CreC
LTKRNRVFLGIVLAFLLGVGYLLYTLLAEIDPRYRESAEESLVETSHLLATLIEEQLVHDGAIDVEPLVPLFRSLYARRFEARIFSLLKQRVELRATVTDAHGRVLFDSRGREVGADHSGWRDVSRALQGRYGARTSADMPDHPTSSVMYVAAPIRWQGRIVGAVSVGKPAQSFGQFVEAARQRTLLVGLTSVIGVLVLMVILSAWLVRPFGLVGDVVRHVRRQRKLSLPRLSRSALGYLGAAYDDMRDALAGRSYVADYVQTLTHELKSPLSAIRGASELLQEPMPEADRQRFAANITREAQRIQELVDRMMELATIESRRALDTVQPVMLAPLLDEIAASARAAGAARGIDVRFEPPREPDGAAVEGDPFLLRRAITNLVDNALDFSPEGSVVQLSLVVKRRVVEVRVRDRGPGIPDYASGKVFEKFYSLERPQGRKSTGLGLAFVREIAELHGGRATLANAVDGPGAVAVLALRRLVSPPSPARGRGPG